MSTTTAERERLMMEAEERWDDEWFLRTVQHADGECHHVVFHSVERVADGVVIRDRMVIGQDGEPETERWLLDCVEYVARIDTEGSEAIEEP